MVLFKHVSPKPSNAEAAGRAVRITEEGRSPAEERGVRRGWNVLRKPSRLRQTVSLFLPQAGTSGSFCQRSGVL